MVVTREISPEDPARTHGLHTEWAFGDSLLRVTLDGPEPGNPLTPALVAELTRLVEVAEQRRARVLVLASGGDAFCSGMDLSAAAADPGATDGSAFWKLLTRLRESPVIVVAAVDGTAAGGGVGLVAASDVVLATARATFALPEALWGLLPCCVVPFLRERVGPSVTRRMTLLTSPVGADEAMRVGLVDDVVPQLDAAVRQLVLRVRRVDRQTHAEAVSFLNALPPERGEARGLALSTLRRIASSELVATNLTRFTQTGTYPWEAR